MNEVIQKAWAEETEEVKKIVEEYRQKPKEEQSGDSQDREARNQSYQRYGFGSMTEFSKEYWLILTYFLSAIDRFPQMLAAMGNSLVDQTGWNLTCIAGGPNLRMGGKITTFA